MSNFSKLLILSFVFLFAFSTRSEANIRTFPAGSYIIPMDSVYQPEADGGIFEAYGLAFDLLENGATVYWIIDTNKVNIGDPDITIYNTVTTPVVNAFPGTTIPGAITDTIIYSGAPWVIVPGEGLDQASVEAILSHPDWSAVDIHVSNVPFSGNVSRELKGAPPTVALLNNSESITTGVGNAEILQTYLALAGICGDTFSIITPDMVRDGILQGTPVTFAGTVYQQDYTIMWAPHWTGYSSYNADNNGDGLPDVENVITNVRTFLEAGNAIFAECASIEVFEHSQNGHYLTTEGINHDGGTMDPLRIIYNDKSSPFPQVGDFTYIPEGGHLHNWRPWSASNSSPNMEAYPFTPVPTVESQYNATVSRFTHDDWDMNLATTNDQWDYYIGGRIDGNETMGYVVYLGGHKYVQTGCLGGGGGGGGGGCGVIRREWEFEFKNDIQNNEQFTIRVDYTFDTSTAGSTTITGLKKGDNATWVVVGGGGPDPLELDFSNPNFSGRKIRNVFIENKGTSPITLTSITVTFDGGGQKTKRLKDKDLSIDLYNQQNTSPFTKPIDVCDVATSAPPPPPPPGGGTIGGCVDNAACTWKNVAGVRYVLNTLFNLQFTVVDVTFIRSSPIVMDNILYQGTFDFPSFGGHVEAFNVMNVNAGPIWDAADSVPTAASRTLFTTVDGVNMIPFTTAELATNVAFQNALNMGVPYVGNEAAYAALVTRVRGEGLGAVEHSAPAVVKPFSRSNNTRPTMLYFGTLSGVLEAFNVDSLHGGGGTPTELWGFIPLSQLAALQNLRNEPSSVQPYPGVDSSPTVGEFLIDTDGNPATDPVWRTVLSVLNGRYGASSSVTVIDITDPANPQLLFEVTGTDASSNPIMGGGFRTSMGSMMDSSGNITNMVFAATNKVVNPSAVPPELGGIQVFAFDMGAGTQVWNFIADYVGTQNDLPGAITLLDKTRNGFIDVVIVGDMDGRLWELNATDGTNVNGAGIPLFNGGPGATVTNAGVDFPITASPTITVNEENHIVLVFGTGGADWAPADATHIHSIIAIDISNKDQTPTILNGAGMFLWQKNLDVGEKAWSSPTVANNTVFVSTAFGTMESANPMDDLNSTTQQGKIRAIDLTTGVDQFSLDVGNQRGSVYIKAGHAYGSTLDGNVVQIGDEDFSSGSPINVQSLSWKEE